MSDSKDHVCCCDDVERSRHEKILNIVYNAAWALVGVVLASLAVVGVIAIWIWSI